MKRIILASLFSLTLAAHCTLAAFAASTDPPVIGKVQSMTVSPKEMTLLKSATQSYLDAALNDEDAFFAAVTPDYRGVSLAGKSYSAGQVFGAVQVLKQPLSGIVTQLRVIDAHHLGPVYDETVSIGGVADTIDSQGAHSVSATWLHKITFSRNVSGNLLVSRDQVIARFP